MAKNRENHYGTTVQEKHREIIRHLRIANWGNQTVSSLLTLRGDPLIHTNLSHQLHASPALSVATNQAPKSHASARWSAKTWSGVFLAFRGRFSTLNHRGRISSDSSGFPSYDTASYTWTLCGENPKAGRQEQLVGCAMRETPHRRWRFRNSHVPPEQRLAKTATAVPCMVRGKSAAP